MNKTEVIILHETAGQSWKRDTSTLVMFVSLIGIGVYLESPAMQWMGAIIGFITICSRSMRMIKDNRMTIEQARALLDKLEGV